jgi:hypothetical protein
MGLRSLWDGDDVNAEVRGQNAEVKPRFYFRILTSAF